MTDCELILRHLQDGLWHNAIEMHRTIKPGTCNWALRSRISDLVKKRYVIDSRIGKNRQAEYKLIKTEKTGQMVWV